MANRAVFTWKFRAYAALVPGKEPSNRLVAGFRLVPRKIRALPVPGQLPQRGPWGCCAGPRGTCAEAPFQERDSCPGKRVGAPRISESPRWWL